MINYLKFYYQFFLRFIFTFLFLYTLFEFSTAKAQNNINGSFTVFGEVGVHGNLNIGADAQVFFQDGSTLQMFGTATTINSDAEIFANTSSTQAGTGRILFVGAAAQTLDGGNSSAIGGAQPSLINVAINNTNNLTLTNTNTRITSGLDFINGHVILGSNNLELSSTASATNANGTRHVVTNGTGFMAKEGFTSAFSFPIGRAVSDFTPAVITPAASDNFFVQVKDYSESASDEFVTTDGVGRTWNIYSSTGAGANIALQHNATTNGSVFDPNDAFVTQYQGLSTSNQGVWQTGTGANAPSASGSVAGSTIRDRVYSGTATSPSANGSFFSKSSNLLTPLPVYDLEFDVTKNNFLSSKLTWSTSSEYNTSHFDIFTSTDGIEWNKLDEVKSVGFSNSLTQYQYIHNNARLGDNYYKIKVVDFSGFETLSDIKIVDFAKSNSNVKVYPNPSNDILQVEATKFSEIQITTIEGKIIDVPMVLLDNIYTFDIKGLVPGIYFLNIKNKGALKSFPIIVNR